MHRRRVHLPLSAFAFVSLVTAAVWFATSDEGTRAGGVAVDGWMGTERVWPSDEDTLVLAHDEHARRAVEVPQPATTTRRFRQPAVAPEVRTRSASRPAAAAVTPAQPSVPASSRTVSGRIADFERGDVTSVVLFVDGREVGVTRSRTRMFAMRATVPDSAAAAVLRFARTRSGRFETIDCDVALPWSPGSAIDVGDVHVPLAPLIAAGRLVEPTGSPLAGVRIRSGNDMSCVSGPDGRFEIRGAHPPAIVELRATRGVSDHDAISVPTGTHIGDWTLEPLVLVHGRAPGAAPGEIVNAVRLDRRASRMARVDDDGAFQFELQPGRWRIERRGRSPESRVEVVVPRWSERRTIDVALRP